MKTIYRKLFELKELTGEVVKGANNPFFKTKYSDLNSVIDATEPALKELGLLYVDRVENMTLVSSVIDVESGESMDMVTPLVLGKNDMQQLGSAISYARRYARMTLFGLKSIDDDGAEAAGTVFIKPAQIKRLNEMILKTGKPVDAALAHFKVKMIKDLTQQQADALESSVKKVLDANKGAQDGK